MVVATATRPGAATGTTSMSNTGTRTTITGTGGTWMPTAQGAIGPTTCPGRDLMISTAATETTGDTEITTTGMWEAGPLRMGLQSCGHGDSWWSGVGGGGFSRGLRIRGACCSWYGPQRVRNRSGFREERLGDRAAWPRAGGQP